MADEISLRELIEILLRRKYIIISITLGALLASFVFSYFIITPVYQTRVVLKIADYRANGAKNATVLRVAPEDYVPLVQDEEFFERIAASKDLSVGYNPIKISHMIDVAADNEKGQLTITAAGKDPNELTFLANTVAAEFVDFSWQAEKDDCRE